MSGDRVGVDDIAVRVPLCLSSHDFRAPELRSSLLSCKPFIP